MRWGVLMGLYKNMKATSCPHKYIIDGEIAIIEVIRRNGKKLNFKIDIEDLTRVLEHRWSAVCYERYFSATIKNRSIYLHHFLIGCPSNKKVVDHKDRNTFNNSKSNLSFVSRSQNGVNRKITNKYNFPGIEKVSDYRSYNKNSKNMSLNIWRARIRIKDKTRTKLLHLGVFPTFETAVLARKDAEMAYYGRFIH